MKNKRSTWAILFGLIAALMLVPATSVFANNPARGINYTKVEYIKETKANTGIVYGKYIARLTGDTFAKGATETSLPSDAFKTSDLPEGVTVKATRISNTQVDFVFSGTAVSHNKVDGKQKFSISFTDSAFTNGAATDVKGTMKSFSITFIDPVLKARMISGFQEATTNKGAVKGSYEFYLQGDKFSFGAGSGKRLAAKAFAVTNLPKGLSPVFKRISDGALEMTLSGKASSHKTSDSVSKVQVVFNDSAFAGKDSASVQKNKITGIKVQFVDQFTISGKVTGPDKKGVKATITVLDSAGKKVSSAKSSGTGDYKVTKVPGGKCTVEISVSNGKYSTYTTTVSKLKADTTINAVLQNAYKVTGTISGSDKKNLPAKVELRAGKSGKVIATVQANSKGAYTFTSIPKGSYKISATHTGYKAGNASVTVKTTDVKNANVVLTKSK